MSPNIRRNDSNIVTGSAKSRSRARGKNMDSIQSPTISGIFDFPTPNRAGSFGMSYMDTMNSPVQLNKLSHKCTPETPERLK